MQTRTYAAALHRYVPFALLAFGAAVMLQSMRRWARESARRAQSAIPLARTDRVVDIASEGSFPASDPPSFNQVS